MKKKMFVGVSALMTPGRPIAGSPLKFAHLRKTLGCRDLVPRVEIEHADVHRVPPSSAVFIHDVAVG